MRTDNPLCPNCVVSLSFWGPEEVERWSLYCGNDDCDGINLAGLPDGYDILVTDLATPNVDPKGDVEDLDV